MTDRPEKREAEEPRCARASCGLLKSNGLHAPYPDGTFCWPRHAFEPAAQPTSGDRPLGEPCSECGYFENNPEVHFDAPGSNWGAALHHYVPPTSGDTANLGAYRPWEISAIEAQFAKTANQQYQSVMACSECGKVHDRMVTCGYAPEPVTASAIDAQFSEIANDPEYKREAVELAEGAVTASAKCDHIAIKGNRCELCDAPVIFVPCLSGATALPGANWVRQAISEIGQEHEQSEGFWDEAKYREILRNHSAHLYVLLSKALPHVKFSESRTSLKQPSVGPQIDAALASLSGEGRK